MAKNKSYNKLIAGTMTAAMVAGVVAPVAASAEQTKSFPDVPAKFWAEESINYLVAKGAINGKPDGTFAPNEEMDRASIAKVVAITLGLEIKEDAVPSFEDAKDNWAAKYIAAVEKAGVIQGDENGKFNPNGKIDRASMASMLVKAYKLDKEVTGTPETKFDDLKNHWGKDYANILVELGISNGTDTGWEPGKAATRAEVAQFIAKTDAKYGEKEEEVKEAQVESVSAINASEVVVTFTDAVDVKTASNKDNYEIKVNNELVDVTDIAISKDGKKATILLNETFQNGDKYVIQTNDAIKSAKGKALEKFVSEEKTFAESAEPKLLSVTPSGGQLTFTFDRPVATNVELIKVDGVAIDAKEFKASTKAGQYTYTVKAEKVAGTTLESAFTEGKHEVVMYDVQDTAAAYPKVASVLKASYTVTDEVTVPQVTDAFAVNANRFFLQTNVGVDLTNATIKVEKGNHEFVLADKNFTNSNLVGETSAVDAEVGTYNGKTGVWVVVTDAAKNDENPLYKGSEKDAELKVTMENYKDAKTNSLIGKKAVQSVTLNKNNSKPEILETKVAGNALDIKFTETIDAQPKAEDVVVRDKDGVIINGLVDGNVTLKASDAKKPEVKDTVSVDLGAKYDSAKEPYTVEFKADKFKYKENPTSVAGYLVNTVKNDNLVATVKSTSTNFKYKEFKLDAATNLTVNADKGTIDINFGEDMDASARDTANYKLDGEALPAGTTVDFYGDKKNVRITLPKGKLSNTTSYKLSISTNVKTEQGSMLVGSLQTKNPVEAIISLKDSVQPELQSAVYYRATEDIKNSTASNKIELTFSEALKSGIDFSEDDLAVTVEGSKVEVEKIESGDKENRLVITLKQDVNLKQAATIAVVAEEDQADETTTIVDLAGNKAKEGSTASAQTSKFNADYAKEVEAEKAKEEAEKEAAKQLADAKNALNTVITDATKLKTDAKVGDQPTEYPQTAVDALETAITTAKNAAGATDATKTSLDNAKSALETAITTFKDAVIK